MDQGGSVSAAWRQCRERAWQVEAAEEKGEDEDDRSAFDHLSTKSGVDIT